MALIGTFEKASKDRNVAHDTIDAKYYAFEVTGQRILQIDTHGRSTRDMPEKVSQSIQLDAKSAKALIQILLNEFDLK